MHLQTKAKKRHCTKCEQSWTLGNKHHCHKCCIVTNKCNHCCSCQCVWDDDQIHCHKCKTVYYAKQNHRCLCQCYNCKTNYNMGEHHCCKCKIIYNAENHCCKCKTNYNMGKKHCCKCQCEYYESQNHCCECEKAWNMKNKIHCEDCCLITKRKQTHCHKCQRVYGKNNTHCCKCQCEYNENQNHCCKCKMVYDKNNVHCCDCKIEYNLMFDYHCCECNEFYEKMYDHCCECKKSWNSADKKHCKDCCVITDNSECNCKKIIGMIKNETANFVGGYRRTKCRWMMSPCLDTKCKSFNKFIAGLKSIGVDDIIDFFETGSNYKFVFHGTPSIDNVKNICCNSWDVNTRHRQTWGCGEYFTTSMNRGKSYASDKGAIIISIIIMTDNTNIRTVVKSETETWFVVDNKTNFSFCLPVAILENNEDIDACNMCPCVEKIVKKKEFDKIKKDKELMVAKLFDDDHEIHYFDNWWNEYDGNIKKQIAENGKKNNMVFNVTCNKKLYKIDLINMIQTNLSSNYQRKIRIV